MKIPFPLSHLKFIKKHLKNGRSIAILTVIAVLLVGVASVAAYTKSQQRIERTVVEKEQSKPALSTPTDEAKVDVVVDEKPKFSDTAQPTVSSVAQPAPANTSKPVVKQPTKPRPHTSEDPAFVACVQKYSDLYVKYNADNAAINAEKNLALATLDELYNSGYYEEIYPGDTEHYNYWQADRAELTTEYNNQLVDLSNTYTTNSSVYLNC